MWPVRDLCLVTHSCSECSPHWILDFEVSLHDNQQKQHEFKMKYLGKSAEDCGSPEKQVTDLSRHKPQGWTTQLGTASQPVNVCLGHTQVLTEKVLRKQVAG